MVRRKNGFQEERFILIETFIGKRQKIGNKIYWLH